MSENNTEATALSLPANFTDLKVREKVAILKSKEPVLLPKKDWVIQYLSLPENKDVTKTAAAKAFYAALGNHRKALAVYGEALKQLLGAVELRRVKAGVSGDVSYTYTAKTAEKLASGKAKSVEKVNAEAEAALARAKAAEEREAAALAELEELRARFLTAGATA